MRNEFSRTLKNVADEIPGIYLIAADISPVSSKEFFDSYPDRFINVGVAEQVMVGVAAGLALRGCRPFAYTIANFSAYRPFEMIRVDLCYQNLPVTIVGMGAGVVYSKLGSTHHTQEDVAVLSGLPNLKILSPCDPSEVRECMWVAARSDGPTYLRLGKAGEPDLTRDAPEPFEFNRIRMIKSGSDIAILSFGPITSMALEVAKQLDASGRSTAVYSCHTLKPFDCEKVARVLNQFPLVATLEEHSFIGGLASRVKEIAWDSKARCHLRNYALKDQFIHCYGSHEELLDRHGLSTRRIYNELNVFNGA